MKPIFIYSDKFLNLISWFMRVGGVSIFPFVILREKHKDPQTQYAFVKSQEIHRHETIHFRQQLEMLVIFFYIWYITEFIIKMFIYQRPSKAYKNLLHEREANKYESDKDYLKRRKLYAWL